MKGFNHSYYSHTNAIDANVLVHREAQRTNGRRQIAWNKHEQHVHPDRHNNDIPIVQASVEKMLLQSDEPEWYFPEMISLENGAR